MALRESIRAVRERFPFVVDAWVLSPEHPHCIWTLPDGDRDFSIWRLINNNYRPTATSVSLAFP